MPAESVASSEHTRPVPNGSAPYIPRRPEQTLLYRTIREQLESFLAHSCDRGHPVPRFVEQELRAFLRCGVLAQGFCAFTATTAAATASCPRFRSARGC